MAQDSSVESSPSDMDSLEVIPYSLLDHWLDDFEDQPWSPFNLSHKRNVQEAKLSRFNKLSLEIDEMLAGFSDDRDYISSPADIDDFSYLNTESTIDEDQEDDYSQSVTLDDLECLTDTLTKYQRLTEELAWYQLEDGKTAELTLQKEFELAREFEKDGYYDEAEHHCSQISKTRAKPIVQCLLGLILAKTSRLEEATSLLFVALTAWIIEVHHLSMSQVLDCFNMIGLLFNDISDKSYPNWKPLLWHFVEITETLEKSNFQEETTDEICPQLFHNGLALAHQCSIFGIIESAKHMYQALLTHSASLADIVLDGMTVAKAHRRYGYLLRKEGRWESSAEELTASGESAMTLGSHSSWFIKLLEEDYAALSPYLKLITIDNESDGPLAKKIQNMLSRYRHHNQELSSRAISSHGDDDHSSTTSGSASRSYNRGETYPRSDSTGAMGYLISMATARELPLRIIGSTYGDDDHSSITSVVRAGAITVG